MKLQMYGQRNIRTQREHLQKNLLEIAGNTSEQRVNEVVMTDVLTSLFNHIEDLEHFICIAAEVEYAQGDDEGMDTNDVHFNRDLFEIS